MVDWTAHVALGWLTARLPKARNVVSRDTLAVGCVLPDVPKIVMMPFMPALEDRVVLAVILPSHAIVGVALLSVAAAFLFKGQGIPKSIASLYLGGLLHLALDLLVRYETGCGVPLLWPLTWRGYSLGLMSANDVGLTVASMSLCIVVYLAEKARGNSDKAVSSGHEKSG